MEHNIEWGDYVIKFPPLLEKVLLEAAERNNLRLEKETHYETINRVLVWFEKNVCKRLDFTLVKEGNQYFIDVTYLENVYPKFLPPFFRWIEQNVPLAPSFTKKNQWKNLDKFPVDLQDGIEEKVSCYINKTLTKLL